MSGRGGRGWLGDTRHVPVCTERCVCAHVCVCQSTYMSLTQSERRDHAPVHVLRHSVRDMRTVCTRDHCMPGTVRDAITLPGIDVVRSGTRRYGTGLGVWRVAAAPAVGRGGEGQREQPPS
eukprot:3092589-Rhodomonas_salina.1